MEKALQDHPLSLDEASYDLAIAVLASGSRGNSIYVTDGTIEFLVDAGISGIQIEQRLRQRGVDPTGLDAIIVSHEHTDHIKGVGVLSRRHSIPVYMTNKTADACRNLCGDFHEIHPIACGRTFSIGEILLHPFPISHDAADPCGFTIQKNDKKIGIATDLGLPTQVVRHHLLSSDLLVLEANHDTEMLINGPYPWALKQRVKGRTGHLSNAESQRLLADLDQSRLKHLIIAHVSETNNRPEMAESALRKALKNQGTSCTVALQEKGSPLLMI